jgi:hypothetical protein
MMVHFSSHLAGLLATPNETESALTNGHCEDELADSPSPPPVTPKPPPPPPLPPPPPPVAKSVESSTDTLVAIMEPITVKTAVQLPEPCMSPPQQSSCHVCASSRRFLLESSVLELCGGGPTRTSSSHYSTPTSYPATPGKCSCYNILVLCFSSVNKFTFTTTVTSFIYVFIFLLYL